MSDLLSKTYKKNRDLPWQTINDETIIVDPANHQSYELNEVGSFIWSQINGANDLNKIQAAICHEYEVDHAVVTQDLLEVANHFVSQNLIIECEV